MGFLIISRKFVFVNRQLWDYMTINLQIWQLILRICKTAPKTKKKENNKKSQTNQNNLFYHEMSLIEIEFKWV